MNPKVSVICCYNDKKVLAGMLENSLNNQSIEIEKIFIDNTRNQYSSSAAALNAGANDSSGDILIFAHQDISLNNDKAISKIIDYLKESHSSIIGYAGKATDNFLYSNMKQGSTNDYAGEKQIVFPKQVQTLDESFVAIERTLFMECLFDEQTCNNWHLYVVDLCLTLGKNNISSYVVPCDAYHLSKGNIGTAFYKSLIPVARKHHVNYPVIYATCATVKTSFFNRLYFVAYNIIRATVKNHLFIKIKEKIRE